MKRNDVTDLLAMEALLSYQIEGMMLVLDVHRVGKNPEVFVRQLHNRTCFKLAGRQVDVMHFSRKQLTQWQILTRELEQLYYRANFSQ